MKSFFWSLALFALAVCIIVCNAIYINRVSDRLQKKLEELPDVASDGCVAAAEALYQDWKKQSNLAELSVSYPILDRVTEQAALLVACAECGDEFGYRSAIALLADAIEDMKRLESIPLFKQNR